MRHTNQSNYLLPKLIEPVSEDTIDPEFEAAAKRFYKAYFGLKAACRVCGTQGKSADECAHH